MLSLPFLLLPTDFFHLFLIKKKHSPTSFLSFLLLPIVPTLLTFCNAELSGKSAFVKFHAPWCGTYCVEHCRQVYASIVVSECKNWSLILYNICCTPQLIEPFPLYVAYLLMTCTCAQTLAATPFAALALLHPPPSSTVWSHTPHNPHCTVSSSSCVSFRVLTCYTFFFFSPTGCAVHVGRSL